MTDDIDKLVKYRDLVKEINELNKQFDEFDSYDSVKLSLSPDATVNIIWENKSGKLSESKRFTLSMIDTFIEKARKNRNYRKDKPGENK